MRSCLNLAVLSCLSLASTACSGEIVSPSGDSEQGDDGSPQARPDAGGPAGPGDSSVHIACVDRINAFRATEGLAPLLRWVEAESCSGEQSGLDATGDGPHGNFGMCGERAQNTCPNWPSTGGIIEGCLQQMWDEGPGEPFAEHGHYLNMSSTEYTKVACGFYEGPDGIWANQNFQ